MSEGTEKLTGDEVVELFKREVLKEEAKTREAKAEGERRRAERAAKSETILDGTERLRKAIEARKAKAEEPKPGAKTDEEIKAALRKLEEEAKEKEAAGITVEQQVKEEIEKAKKKKKDKKKAAKAEASKVEEASKEAAQDPEKEAKRQAQWAELIAKIPREFTPRDGGKWDGRLDIPFVSVAMSTRETIQIPGYNLGPKRSFKQVFGTAWNVAAKELEPLREKNGRVVTVSVGNNHYIVVLPVKEIELVDRDGNKFTLKREEALQHMQGGTNHGRVYKKARHIAKAYGLAYDSIEPGEYTRSNVDNYNFSKRADGKWQIYTKQKNSTKPVNFTPEEFLKDLVAGGELWKVING